MNTFSIKSLTRKRISLYLLINLVIIHLYYFIEFDSEYLSNSFFPLVFNSIFQLIIAVFNTLIIIIAELAILLIAWVLFLFTFYNKFDTIIEEVGFRVLFLFSILSINVSILSFSIASGINAFDILLKGLSG